MLWVLPFSFVLLINLHLTVSQTQQCPAPVDNHIRCPEHFNCYDKDAKKCYHIIKGALMNYCEAKYACLKLKGKLPVLTIQDIQFLIQYIPSFQNMYSEQQGKAKIEGLSYYWLKYNTSRNQALKSVTDDMFKLSEAMAREKYGDNQTKTTVPPEITPEEEDELSKMNIKDYPFAVISNSEIDKGHITLVKMFAKIGVLCEVKLHVDKHGKMMPLSVSGELSEESINRAEDQMKAFNGEYWSMLEIIVLIGFTAIVGLLVIGVGVLVNFTCSVMKRNKEADALAKQEGRPVAGGGRDMEQGRASMASTMMTEDTRKSRASTATSTATSTTVR